MKRREYLIIKATGVKVGRKGQCVCGHMRWNDHYRFGDHHDIPGGCKVEGCKCQQYTLSYAIRHMDDKILFEKWGIIKKKLKWVEELEKMKGAEK